MVGIRRRPVIGEAAVYRAARHLADTLTPFAPTTVLYIASGGEMLGREIAARLGISVDALDIRYPASRVRDNWARRLVFPFKEVLYRLSRPTIRSKSALRLTQDARIVLVDDSAATGRTLRVALAALQASGIPRERVRTAVFRKGSGASDLVDCFETTERVRFEKN